MSDMDSKIERLVAANRLRELLCMSITGDLLHELGDVDAIDLAQKLVSRIGDIARSIEADRG